MSLEIDVSEDKRHSGWQCQEGKSGLPHPGKVLESPGFFLLSWKVLESP